MAKIRDAARRGDITFLVSAGDISKSGYSRRQLAQFDLVFINSTRPEPIEIPYIQPGGFLHGHWVFHKGKLIESSISLHDYKSHYD